MEGGGGCRGEEEGLGGGVHTGSWVKDASHLCFASCRSWCSAPPIPCAPSPPPKIHPGMKEGAALLSPPSSPKPQRRDGGSGGGGGVQEQEDTSALRPQVNTGLKQLHGEKC